MELMGLEAINFYLKHTLPKNKHQIYTYISTTKKHVNLHKAHTAYVDKIQHVHPVVLMMLCLHRPGNLDTNRATFHHNL